MDMGVGCWLGKTQTHSTVSVFDTVSNTCRNYVKSMYKLSSFYDVMTRCFARFKAALRGRAVKLSLIFGFVSTINIQDTAVYCLIRSTDMKKKALYWVYYQQIVFKHIFRANLRGFATCSEYIKASLSKQHRKIIG